jgi:hypothetical protein
VVPCEEKPDVGLKDRVKRRSVPLLRRILGREQGLEFTDQQAHLVGHVWRKLDPHPIAAAHRSTNSSRCGILWRRGQM